jgi:hypothetical protein
MPDVSRFARGFLTAGDERPAGHLSRRAAHPGQARDDILAFTSFLREAWPQS